MACRLCLLTAACLLIQAASVSTQQHSHGRMNPIRKVVNLMMAMQTKVEAEGKQTGELFDKFMCNAKTVSSGLEKSIADAQERGPQLESGIKEATAEHQQLAEDLKQAKEDRAAALKAQATANSIREKEAAEFAKESTSQKGDIDAVTKAIAAVTSGQGAFLQTKASAVLRRLSMSSNMDLGDVDRDLLSNFLQGGSQEPSSGEVLGIMKQMHEEMTKDLASMVSDEEGAVADHESLITAKTKEIKANTKAIEVKMGRKGELAVQLTKLKNDLEDTEESLVEDGKFLGETKRAAQVKETEFDAYKKAQAQELVALADTIKMLNDDDALDLFKKTLPSPAAASLIQLPVTSKQMKRDALRVLHQARQRARSHGHKDPRLDLLALWVQGRKGGSFGEVLTKIDKLIGNLKKEQADDDTKKSWCLADVDKTEEEIKWTARSASDVQKIIASAKEDLKAVLVEVGTLTKGIKDLDASVLAATKQRKAESAASNAGLAENGAAKQLLEMAKNRLNQFYNPKLVEAPAKKETAQAGLMQEGTLHAQAQRTDDAELDRASDDGDEVPSFVQVRSHSSSEDEQLLGDTSISDSQDGSFVSEADDLHKPAAAQESSGVLEMINLLKEDLGKQILEIELDEKEAQKDYEVFMKDSSDKRAIDSKSVADKESAKAKVETELQKAKVKLSGEQASLMESKQELSELHGDCDWLLKTFDARKSAREDESDAMTKARAVLSGADYS